MKVLVNFNNGSVYCLDCAKKLNIQPKKNLEIVETWNKPDFEYVDCFKCGSPVYEGNIVNGQHLAMFI